MASAKAFKEMIISLLGIVFVFVFPHLGVMPMFTYTVPVILLIWLLLKRAKETFSDIGFSFKRFEVKAIWIGTATGILLFCFLQYLFFPLLGKIFPLAPADLSGFASLRHHPGMYIFVLCMGWLVGGLYEEIAFHGFIFTRLKKMMGGRYATAAAVAITAIIFAMYHIQLGTSGVINALLAGLGYHLLMLKYKRNSWYAFFAHGIFDTIGLTFIYLGYW